MSRSVRRVNRIGRVARVGGMSGPVAPAGAVFATASHPTGRTVDAAHLVPVVAGDAIRWQRELVSGTWYEQATSGLRAVAGVTADKWYDGYDGTRKHLYPSQSLPVGSAARTIGLCARPLSFSPAGCLLHYGTGSNNQSVFVLVDGGGVLFLSQFGDALRSPAGVMTLNTWCRILVTISGNNWTGYVDGVQVVNGTMATATVGTNLTLGSDVVNNWATADIARAAVWPTALSGTALTAADAWLREGYP